MGLKVSWSATQALHQVVKQEAVITLSERLFFLD